MPSDLPLPSGAVPVLYVICLWGRVVALNPKTPSPKLDPTHETLNRDPKRYNLEMSGQDWRVQRPPPRQTGQLLKGLGFEGFGF